MVTSFTVKLRLFLLFALMVFGAGFTEAQVYTFTPAGATGIDGPDQSQVNTAYSSTSLAGNVTVVNGIQHWHVPVGGTYKIEVYGANGHGTYGGRGAYMSGEFTFNPNDELQILVGQQGGCCVGSGTNQYGGGGGTFVVDASNLPLIIAGGGGGANGVSAIPSNADASTTTSGNDGSGTITSGAGGTNGDGGVGGSNAGAGGGFSTDGSGASAVASGKAFMNGGQGGTASTSGGWGGFGGGGGGDSYNNNRGCGGGGYSGGGGGGSSVSGAEIGGGGGSFNSGTNQINTAALGTGDGQVIITLLAQAVSVPNNVGVTGFPSLSNGLCSGGQPISVSVRNFGSNPIDSVKIAWEVDGVSQGSSWFHVGIDTFPVNPYDTTITIGTYTFSTPGTTYNIKAWTLLPNNQTDTVNTNDTMSIALTTRMSGTYTINAGAAASATNYQTIDSFTNSLEAYGVCGPVVANVVSGSGPYDEFVNIGDIPGASSVNTIRINGNGETVQYTNTTSDRQLLTLDGAKYVTIDSLKFKAQDATYGWGALITNGAAYDSIIRCEFDLSSITSTSSANSSGICFSASSTSATSTGSNGSHCYIGHNHIKGTTGSGSCYYGITVAGSSDSNIIEHNLIENFYYYGLYINGAIGTHALYNEITRATKTSVTTFYGLYTTGVTPGTQIIGNRIHTPGGTNGGTGSCYALRLLGDGTVTEPVLVANNAIYDINQGGTVYSMYLSSSPYNLIYNNTVNLDQTLGSTSTNYGIYASGTNTGTEVKNNNISITAGGTGTKYGFYYSTAASIDDAQENNIYVNSTQSGTQNYGYYSGAFATQSAFQTANPTLEVGSPAVDPLFVNAATGDLTPQSLSLLGQGLNLTNYVPKDINGNPRPTTPAIGAFEQPPTGSNNAGVLAFLSPAGNYCPGSQMVNLSVYNAGINNITSLQINWSVNGVTQTPVNYTGTLVPLTNSVGQNSDTIALGNVSFSNTTPTNIDVWLSFPNGVTDTITSNDSLSGTFQAPQLIVSTASDTLCAGNNVTLDLSPNAGYNPGDLTWQSSGDGTTWTNITNSDTVSYTDSTMMTSTWYRVKLGTSNTCYSDSIQVVILNLNIDSVHNAERCGPGAVNLEAFGTPGSEIKWYTSNTSTSPVGTGNTFTTPALTNTDTFWVASSVGNGSGYVGPESPSSVSSSGGYTTSTTYVTYFTVNLPTTIMSVDIFPNTTGQSGQLQITDENTGATVGTYSFTTTTSGSTTNGQTIAINQPLPPGDYSIGMANTSVSMYRNTLGGNYPYSTPVISITGNGFNNTDYYYYMYNMQYSSGCESAREPVIATINPLPAVDLGNDTSICPGIAIITLDAGSQGVSYLWNTGASSQTITVDTGMTYSVTVTGANGCTNSDTVIVQNGINPVRVLPTSLELCAGDIDSLNAGNPGSTYSWNSGETTQKLGVQTAGTYHVSITSATGCTIEDSATVIVHALPVVNIGADTALCPGDNVTLDAGNSGSGNSFLWNTTASTQTISASDSGIYTVTVTNVYGCQQDDSIHIATNPAPVNVLPDTTDWCTGTTPNLDAGNAGSDYLWSTGDISQTVPVNASGAYTVTITNTYGCSITSATEVVVRQTPIVNLRTDTSICSGVSITLDAGAQPSGSSYTWSNGDTTQTTQAFGGGLYTATVTNQYGCTTSDDVNIGLLPNPVVTGINEAQNPNGSFIFSASGLQNISSITGYEWDFGDNTGTSTLEHPTHTYASNGIYTVRLVVFSICGSDTVYKDIQITVNGIGQISLEQTQLKLYPNPATDQITIKNESPLKMEAIQVYNILGQKVLISQVSDPNTYTLHTQALASGVYQIRISFTNGQWLTRKFEIKK